MDVDQDIELNIEQLVLHGFDPADRIRIANAIQEELTALFTTQGVSNFLSQGSDLPILSGGTFQTPISATASSLGIEVAGSVFKSMG